MFVVAAYWRAREGQEEACAAILRTVARVSQEHEPGCRMFVAHQSNDDPRDFMLYEQYDDEDALKAHRETEHFKKYVLDDAVANDRLEKRWGVYYTLLD